MDGEARKKLKELAARFKARVWHTDEAKVVKGEKGGVMAWANSQLAGEYLEAACPANILALLAGIDSLEADAEKARKKLNQIQEEHEAEVEAARKKAAELRAKVNALADIALFFEMGLELNRSPLARGAGPFGEARLVIGKAKTARAKLILKMLDDLEALHVKRREKLMEDAGEAVAGAERREAERRAG